MRTRFQIRASSIVPWNAPVATPVELSATPRPAYWMLSNRGMKGPPVSVNWVSRLPFKYRRHVEVVLSYVTAAWYQMLSQIGVTPITGWLALVAVSSKSATNTRRVRSMPRK